MKKLFLYIFIPLLSFNVAIAENLRITCHNYETLYPDKPSLKTQSGRFSLDFEFDFDQKRIVNFDFAFLHFDENNISWISDDHERKFDLDGVERTLRFVSIYDISRNSGTAISYMYSINKNFEKQYNNLKKKILNFESGQQMNAINDFIENIPKKQRIFVMYKYNCEKSKQKF
jgi:hypothetical protein|tara:strand:- start:86 stop:604 length:519 start_codon:yes stop_codon:yes gene_type:complete